MSVNLSPWDMVVQADVVVQAVMGGLLFASVLCWTVALAKALELAAFARRTRADLALLAAARGLDAPLQGPCAPLLHAARDELVSAPGGPEGVKERADWRIRRLIAAQARALSRGTGILATIGATAPFVGLFGTVWGIMNSFVGIARMQTTNLAVVAPGIAEALLATAIGLVAAIPAVLAYNKITTDLARFAGRMESFATEFAAILSRQTETAANDKAAPAASAAE